MASAQSDDSGQFHQLGRARLLPRGRFVTMGTGSPLQPGTGRIPAFPGPGSCSIPPTQPPQIRLRKHHKPGMFSNSPSLLLISCCGGKVVVPEPPWSRAHWPPLQSISGSSTSVSVAQRSSRAASERRGEGSKVKAWRCWAQGWGKTHRPSPTPAGTNQSLPRPGLAPSATASKVIQRQFRQGCFWKNCGSARPTQQIQAKGSLLCSEQNQSSKASGTPVPAKAPWTEDC